MTFNPNPNDPTNKKDATAEHKENGEEKLSLYELIQIQYEINDYENGDLPLSSLSGKALKFLESGEDLEILIKKAEEEKRLEKEMESRNKEIEEKTFELENWKKDLESEIVNLEAKYEELDKEFDHLDNSGVSTIAIGKEMNEVQERKLKLIEELEKIKKEIRKIIDEI